MSSNEIQRSLYQENLERLTKQANGKMMLNLRETANLLGFKDTRTAKRRFPFVNGYITLATLAHYLPQTEKDADGIES